MALLQAYYLIPFWLVAIFTLRLVVGSYTAILLAALMFGALEIMKGKKTDDIAWQSITKDLSIIGHKGCALNAPENTIAGEYY